MVNYIGNIHGDETVGRQLILYLAQYLLHNYGKDPRITKLMDDTEIFLMPSSNPDGFTVALPEQGKIFNMLMKMLLQLEFRSEFLKYSDAVCFSIKKCEM